MGESLASNPTPEVTPAMQVLYWMRRNHGQATDDQIKQFAGLSEWEAQQAINKLASVKAIVAIG
jgi:hypothetical protein